MNEQPSSTTTGFQVKSHLKDTITLTDAQKQEVRQGLVQTAEKLLGVPYVYGAEWTDYAIYPKSLDCSELIEGIYLINGLYCPDGSQYQFKYFARTTDPQPGDLAFFGKGGDGNKVYHVGIVFDSKNMVEARGYEPGREWTGKVTQREIKYWEAYKPNFLGYKIHPLLAL